MMHLRESHGRTPGLQHTLHFGTIPGKVRGWLCWFLVALFCCFSQQAAPVFAHDATLAQERPPAILEIRYHQPDASEVFFVWGVNGWRVLPLGRRPAGTTLRNDVMYTPMIREGDTVSVRILVPAGATIDYGFHITRTRSGAATDIYDGDARYHLKVTEQYDVVEVFSTLALGDDPSAVMTVEIPSVTQEIRYTLPEAGQVFLVWGINGWDVVPEEDRPAGTVLQRGIMHTPMTRDGDTFVASLEVPAGAKIMYGFLVTQTFSGDAADVWDGDEAYQVLATEDDVVEVLPAMELWQDAEPANTAEVPLVTQEIRYHMPEAGQVFLAWGINDWGVVPEENWPAGTVLQRGIMHTPMVREGDAFVASVQVPAGAKIKYGFLVTQTSSGAVVDIWDGAEANQVLATENDVIEVLSALELPQDAASASATEVPLVTQEIRYHMPEAGEVSLVWGINDWDVVPEENRPAGTVLQRGIMHTPMTREGDVFVASVQVPAGATMNYSFLITELASGIAVKVWETDADHDYHSVVTQDGVSEVQTTLWLSQDQESEDAPGSALPWLIGILAVLAAVGLAIVIAQRYSVMARLLSRSDFRVGE